MPRRVVSTSGSSGMRTLQGKIAGNLTSNPQG
jgi:hypothetical protein